MNLHEIMAHLEQSGQMNSFTFSALITAMLRLEARKQPDAAAYFRELNTIALEELEAMKFSDAETPEESQVRENARIQIASLIALASAPAAGERAKKRRP